MIEKELQYKKLEKVYGERLDTFADLLGKLDPEKTYEMCWDFDGQRPFAKEIDLKPEVIFNGEGDRI